MRINRNRLAICFLFILCVLVFSPKIVFAAASVSVSGGAWDIGTKAASSESTSTANQWTVTNDNTGGTEDVLIKVASTLAWTASTDATLTANEFLLRKDNSSGQIITATDGNLVTGLANNGTNSFGLYFKAPPTGSEEGAHTLTVTLTATNWVFSCGGGLAITHTAGAVAPVTKSVTYGTVTSSLSGASKCWITQNLGATTNADSATESTEPNAGWYWQFNRAAGWRYDTSLYRSTSPTTWDSSGDNTYTGWDPAKDPCTLLLDTGWRLPTSAEWSNADATGGWANYNNTYASVLKLHAAGVLDLNDGVLGDRGNTGYYWSSSQLDSTLGSTLGFYSSFSNMYDYSKAYGFSVRCLKD